MVVVVVEVDVVVVVRDVVEMLTKFSSMSIFLLNVIENSVPSSSFT